MNDISKKMLVTFCPIAVGLMMVLSLELLRMCLHDGARKGDLLTILLVGLASGSIIMIPFLVISSTVWELFKQSTSMRKAKAIMIYMLLPVTLYSGFVFGVFLIEVLTSDHFKSTGSIGYGILYLLNFPLLIIGYYLGKWFNK